MNDGDRPRLRLHDLRHTFASILVAQGHDVVFVSEQLGHASPTITLGVYSHLFGQAQHAQRARDALEAAYGTVLEPSGGEGRRNGVPASSAEVVDLQGTGY